MGKCTNVTSEYPKGTRTSLRPDHFNIIKRTAITDKTRGYIGYFKHFKSLKNHSRHGDVQQGVLATFLACQVQSVVGRANPETKQEVSSNRVVVYKKLVVTEL